MKVVLAVELVGFGEVIARVRDRLIRERKAESMKCIVGVFVLV